MSRNRRPWGVIAGPIIFMMGLLVIAGVRTAEGWKEEVEGWGHELRNTDRTVRMDMPVYIPMFVAGDWVGQLETVVVQRERPGAVDNITVTAAVGDRWDASLLAGCAVELRVSGNHLNDFKNVFRCVADTSGLLEFGNLVLTGNVHENFPLYVRVGGLPCDEQLSLELTPCARVKSDIGVEMRAIAEELAVEAQKLRAQTSGIREEIRNQVRQNIRESIRH